MWIDLPVPIYQKLYFFNITNPVEFREKGSAMEVSEVGPFTYRSYWHKNDIQYHENGTISYREEKTFKFVLEESVADESQTIYTLNGPLIFGSNFLKNRSSALQKSANVFFKFSGEKIIVKKTIAELSFQGYKDSIIKIGRYLNPEMPFKNGEFSWLFGRNATDDGLFEVYTGKLNHDMLSMIYKWNGSTHLNYWKGDECNKISGTNGEFGPALQPNQSTYTFFQPIFCRSMTFNYTEDYTHKGVLTKRFVNHKAIFANSQENPENYCFENNLNLPSGVLDISSCQYDAPVYLSFPHFYLADSSYTDNVAGLHPSETNHSSHIDVEPQIGITVDLAIRFQLNLEIENIPNLSELQNIPPGLYPIFWTEISVQFTQELADFLYNRLKRPVVATYAVLGLLFAVSTVLVSCAIIDLLIWKSYKAKDDDEARRPLLSDGDKSNYSSVFQETGSNNISHDSPSSQARGKEKASSSKPSESRSAKLSDEPVLDVSEKTESSHVVTAHMSASSVEVKIVDSRNRKNELMK
ncbi:scavenger receptor class B member 1-like [Uloborus diversus]|uniref:scavenger receptor class B member 1-like n=1 Tax=Uloborus diversus TaxID=327109 RepID=UPI0024096D14|nr:scavenger receptor class B member 1-like [Uloborus diversus]